MTKAPAIQRRGGQQNTPTCGALCTADRTRTCNLRIWNPLLYHLSYLSLGRPLPLCVADRFYAGRRPSAPPAGIEPAPSGLYDRRPTIGLKQRCVTAGPPRGQLSRGVEHVPRRIARDIKEPAIGRCLDKLETWTGGTPRCAAIRRPGKTPAPCGPELHCSATPVRGRIPPGISTAGRTRRKGGTPSTASAGVHLVGECGPEPAAMANHATAIHWEESGPVNTQTRKRPWPIRIRSVGR